MLDFISDHEHIPFGFYMIYLTAITLIFVVAINYIRKSKNPFYDNSSYTKIFFAFFTVFALFYCLDSDYFNYRQWVYNSTILGRKDNIEIYEDLIPWCNGNFELFRLIVWGGALLLVYMSSCLLKISPLLTLLLLFCFFYNLVCYARATLGMAVYFFGISLFLTSMNVSLKKLLSIAIIICSIFFHREMLVIIIMTPIIFIPLNKKTFIIYGILLIVAIFIFLRFYNIGNLSEEYVDKISNYQEKLKWGETAKQGKNWKGLLNEYLGYFLFFMTFIFISVKIFSKKNIGLIDRNIILLHRITFGIMSLSIALFLSFGAHNVFFYRILFVSQIPICLMLSYLFSNGFILKKNMYQFLTYAMLWHLYSFSKIILDNVFR